MRNLISIVIILIMLIVPVSAQELEAPLVPESGSAVMPDSVGDFGEGFSQILQNILPIIQPNLGAASSACMTLVTAVLLVSLAQTVSEQAGKTAEMTGGILICIVLLNNTRAMISLAIKTIAELSEYEKLLLPVLSSAVAAQGGITTAAALYAGTMLFVSLLSRVIAVFFIPAVYLFLAASAANNVTEEGSLGRLKDLLKSAVSWSLKTIITVFTSYIGITGVISGTTDAAALKAAKVTISSVVPVVGGILSDASEAVLVGAGLIKNSIGIYGIFAVISIYAEPFVVIGVQYFVLKFTAAICSIIGSKKITGLIDDYSTAMGLLLAMTGSLCIMLLISGICFLKGVR